MAQRNDERGTGRKRDAAEPLVNVEPAELNSGFETVLRTLSAIHDSVIVSSETGRRGIGVPVTGASNVHTYDDPVAALTYALGLGSTGFSTGLLLDTSRPAAIRDTIESAVTRQIPLTIVLSRPLTVTTDSGLAGAHAALRSVLDLGAPVLSASTAQQAVDFVSAAQLISALVLMPVIVVVDGRETLWSLQETSPIEHLVRVEEATTGIAKYREMLFGSDTDGNRAWIDPLEPMEVGAPVPDALGVKQRIGRHAFIYSEVESLVRLSLAAIEKDFGRRNEQVLVSGRRDADVVLVTTGSLGVRLANAISQAESQKVSVAVITIAQIRPFPTAHLASFLTQAKRVGVIGVGAGGDPEVSAFVEDVKASVFSGQAPKPENESRRRKKQVVQEPALVFPILCAESWHPGAGEVTAIAERLQAETSPRLLIAGGGVSGQGVRFPDVERIRQTIQASQIDLASYEIGATAQSDSAQNARVMIAARSARDTWRLLSTVANLISQAGATGVRASFHRSSDATTHPVVGQVEWEDLHIGPVSVLAIGNEIFGTLPIREILPQSSRILLLEPPESTFPRGTAVRFPHWIAARGISMSRIDIEGLDIAAVPIESIADWALIGAFLCDHPLFQGANTGNLISNVRHLGHSGPGSPESFLTEIKTRIQDVPPDAFDSATGIPPEPEAPAEVAAAAGKHSPVADLARFWKTTGVLYRDGRLDEAPADPFLSAGALPARSGSLTQQLLGAKPLPHVIPERCTGCGACWTMCPESAFSSSLFTLEDLFDAAHASAAKNGTAFLQLPRLRPAIVKTMHRLAGRDDLHQLTTGLALMEEATSQVLEKAGLDDEKQDAVREEMDILSRHVAAIRPIRTGRYFDGPEKNEKGAGRFLGLTIDPFACTTCGLCISSCSDAALERTDTPALSQAVQSEWHQLLELGILPPQLPDEVHTAPDRSIVPMALVGRSTDRVFRAGGADVGNVNRTVLRLFLESAMVLAERKHAALRRRLETTIARIDDRLQEEIRSTFEINDFEAFARKLQEVPGVVDRSSLTDLVSGSGSRSDFKDTEGLSELAKRRSECSNMLSLMAEQGGKASSAYMVLIKAMSYRSFGLAGYPINPFAMPCYATTAESAGDLAAGVYDGLLKRSNTLSNILSATNRMLEGVFEPPDASGETGPESVDGDPASVPLILLVTDRLAPDILRLLADNRPIKVLLMSDGLPAATISGIGMNPVDAVLGMEHVYFHQTALSDPVSLLESLIHAHAYAGPSLLHVYAPDPVRDGLAADEALGLARIALESRLFPSVLREPGRPLKLLANPRGSADYPTPGDWMLAQERFAGSFSFVPRRDWQPDQVPLRDWLTLSAEERIHHQGYLEKIRPDGFKTRYVCGPEVTRLALSVNRTWHRYQEITGLRPIDSAGSLASLDNGDDVAGSSSPPAPVSTDQPVADALNTLSERLFEMSGFRDAQLSLAEWKSKERQNGNDSGGTE